MKKLNQLNLNEMAVINKIETQGDMRRRLLDIGLVENTKVKCVCISPQGDPKAYLIRGSVIAIRNVDSREILIEAVM